MSLSERLTYEEDVARAEAAWAREALTTAPTSFQGEQLVAGKLGGRLEDGIARFGFWTPELLDARVPAGDIFLEVLAPLQPLDLTRAAQDVPFERAFIPVVREEAHCFTAVSGMRAGTREIGRRFLRADMARCGGPLAPHPRSAGHVAALRRDGASRTL
jgi:hypothetical protein